MRLLQPILTVVWSALLLGERIHWMTALAAVGVIASVAVTQQARIRHRSPARLDACARR